MSGRTGFRRTSVRVTAFAGSIFSMRSQAVMTVKDSRERSLGVSVLLYSQYSFSFSSLSPITHPSSPEPSSYLPPAHMGVGARPTFGGGKIDIFARKYMYEQLTKCPGCYMIFARKFSSGFFFGGGEVNAPCLIRLCPGCVAWRGWYCFQQCMSVVTVFVCLYGCFSVNTITPEPLEITKFSGHHANREAAFENGYCAVRGW